MAALFASMAVKSALDNLSSLLPARTTSTPFAATASSKGIEHLRMLKPVMSTIHATLHDAEEHWNLREESAMLRVKELTDLAYDAEDVVEEYEYEVSRCRVEAFEESSAAVVEGGGSSSKHRRRQEVQDNSKYYSTGAAGIVPVPTELVHRASKIIERFAEIKEYADSFTLSEKDGERRIVPDIRTVRQTSSIVYAPRILGREEDKEQVVRMLKLGSSEGSCIGSHISVLAIVGMGGLGKTTLAQLVYNDTKVRQSFDLFAWVSVSEYFDVENITRKMITSLTRNTCHHLQAGVLQAALEDHVKEERVFLVMDDVWNERSDYWELLCAPLSASRQCHIIVTTRSKAVARLVQTTQMYNLNCLSPDDSWSLFKQTALVQQEIITPTNLLEIGRRITEKCKGLPLAIKTLGSTLRYETNENKWRDILENELWNINQSRDQVLPALELSYKYMPMYLKRCFVSLSLFRKNMHIDEYRVVSLWKLLGILQCDGSDNTDEIGSIYFNELVQRSLLQHYIEEQWIRMHDLVHDLACVLAGGEFFRLEGGKKTELPRDVRYLSILSPDKSIQVSSNAPQSLRVITMMELTDVENPEVLVFNCKKLRIIDVESGRLANAILDFIGDMRLLRHFSLSGYEDDALPNSVDKLFNLRSLSIDAKILSGIGRLVNLHTLPEIHFSRCGSFFNIRELRNMNEIRKLVMYGLSDVITCDANEAHLHCKKNLEILQLKFCKLEEYSTDSTVCAVQLLESLRPHHQSLKVLRLLNFNLEIYPSWLGSSSFTMLTEIQLHNCQSRHLPTLGELPSLKSLGIRGMEHVQCIGHEFCSLDPRVKGFQSLKELGFHDMYQLSEWIEVEDGEFPRLETLKIWSAFELRSLPLVPFLSLSNLRLYDCRTLLTFPASPALRELSISTCATLNELPALPSLQSLELFNCPNLATVGHFPSLSVLELHAPFKEEIFHRLVNSHLSLERLSVWSDTLTSIDLEPQSLPSLTELELAGSNLNYCGGLVSLTSLKILNIGRSPQLQVPGSLRTQLENLLMPLSTEWITQSPKSPTPFYPSQN